MRVIQPLYAARLEDLGPGDFVRVECEGTITVRFESSDTSWRLSVCDNGVGMTTSLTEPPAKSGLGTSIIEALTRQFSGRLTISDAAPGTTVSMIFPRVS